MGGLLEIRPNDDKRGGMRNTTIRSLVSVAELELARRRFVSCPPPPPPPPSSSLPFISSGSASPRRARGSCPERAATALLVQVLYLLPSRLKDHLVSSLDPLRPPARRCLKPSISRLGFLQIRGFFFDVVCSYANHKFKLMIFCCFLLLI